MGEKIESYTHQLDQIEKEKHKTKEQMDEILKMKKQISSENKKLMNETTKLKALSEDYFKPYPSKHVNRMVWRNPELGLYECFYNNDKPNPKSSELVHRWVWKKHNGRYPWQGYHIHHIDEDKYNNDPRNLEEIEGKEHYEIHKDSSFGDNKHR